MKKESCPGLRLLYRICGSFAFLKKGGEAGIDLLPEKRFPGYPL
ncbi:hypothetical protein [Neglectibacter caecimuris]|nr:hypothetical protein [Neglectibacter sp. M00184]